MTARREEAGGFQVKVLYRIPELAAMIGMPHWTLRRWLKRREVPVLRVGTSTAVPLVAFRAAFPDVWASLTTVSRLHGSVADAERGEICARCGRRGCE